MLLTIQTAAERILENAQHNPSLYLSILFALFEIFVRLRPTEKNLSILAKIGILIQAILPNYSKEETIEKVGKEAKKIIRKKFPY